MKIAGSLNPDQRKRLYDLLHLLMAGNSVPIGEQTSASGAAHESGCNAGT